jgi:hypothetical protein
MTETIRLKSTKRPGSEFWKEPHRALTYP